MSEDTASFTVVEDAAGPSLSEAGAAPAAGPAGAELGAPPAVRSWTPEEAAAFVCSLYNVGILIYGPAWAAHPSECVGWDRNAAELLERFAPKGTNALTTIVSAVAVLGGLGFMTVRRYQLLKEGPHPIWEQFAPAAAPAPSPAPARADMSPPTPGGYTMPDDLAATAAAAAQQREYEAMGIVAA